MSPRQTLERVGTSRAGRRVLHALEPSKWWIVIFGAGLIAVVVWLTLVYRGQAQAQSKTQRLEAAHIAEILAQGNAAYVACVRSITTNGRIDHWIDGQRAVDLVLLEDASALLDLTAPGREHDVRAANLHRLTAAVSAGIGASLTIPTVAECAAERAAVLRQP